MDVLNEFDQIIVYGANGWLGRSALSVLHRIYGGHILAIGSKDSEIIIDLERHHVFKAENSFSKIKDNSLFLNFAFLRREKIKEIGIESFMDQNHEISKFASETIKSGSIKTFINLSSGVAGYVEHSQSNEPYAKLKFDYENIFGTITAESNVNFLNSRIYSISGRFINEFNHLAISNFIQQAKIKKSIYVKSPETLRNYVCAEDYVSVLLGLSNLNGYLSIDSGGTVVNFMDLAKTISEKFSNCDVLLDDEQVASPDYLGDSDRFNKIANDLKIPLKSIEDQVSQTLLAF
jgi:hypothetical protein